MTIALVIYIISLILIITSATLIKEANLVMWGIVPIINTILLITFIVLAIKVLYKEHKKQQEQKPFYHFLNTKM